MERNHARIPVEAYFAVVFTAILIALLTLQVFFRFVLNKSISWAEEVARFAFLWAVYSGIVLAAHGDRHIRVTMQLRLLPEALQRVVLTVADVVWIIFNGIVAYYAVEFVLSMFRFPYISQTTGINLVYVYTIVPLGFIFMTVRVAQSAVKRFRGSVEIKDSRLDM